MNLEILTQWTEKCKRRIGFSDEMCCELCLKKGNTISFPIYFISLIGVVEKERICLCKECLEKLLKKYNVLELDGNLLKGLENPRKLNIEMK